MLRGCGVAGCLQGASKGATPSAAGSGAPPPLPKGRWGPAHRQSESGAPPPLPKGSWGPGAQACARMRVRVRECVCVGLRQAATEDQRERREVSNESHPSDQGMGSERRQMQQKLCTLLDLCVSSLRRGHANLLCIVPILTDDPRRESTARELPESLCDKEGNAPYRFCPEQLSAEVMHTKCASTFA